MTIQQCLDNIANDITTIDEQTDNDNELIGLAINDLWDMLHVLEHKPILS